MTVAEPRCVCVGRRVGRKTAGQRHFFLSTVSAPENPWSTAETRCPRLDSKESDVASGVRSRHGEDDDARLATLHRVDRVDLDGKRFELRSDTSKSVPQVRAASGSVPRHAPYLGHSPAVPSAVTSSFSSAT